MQSSPVLGVDTGGTFTDFVLAEAGDIRIHKLPSTPDDPARAFLSGVLELGLSLMEAEGTHTPAAAPGRPFQAVHGTTVATNAVLERKGARTAFVTTRG